MSQGYKGEKEAFVSGLTGSSIGHVNLISLNAWVSCSLLEGCEFEVNVMIAGVHRVVWIFELSNREDTLP